MSLRFAFLGLVAMTLAACNKNPLEVTVSRCPAVAVVGDAGTLTRFEGSGRNQEDVAFTASIVQVSSACSESESVTMQVDFQLAANAGPALAGRSEAIEYFVTVMKDNSQIISKKTFKSVLVFDGKGQAVTREAVRQFIPTIEQARRYNYEVLLGFQLSPQEAVYNMER